MIPQCDMRVSHGYQFIKMLKMKWPYKTMDEWQKNLIELVQKIIEAKNQPEKFKNLIQNFILLCGRQVGKSEIVGYCIALILMEIPGIRLLIVSGVERQASGLYNKVLNYIDIKDFKKVKGGNPLRTKFTLKNKSTLITEPIGNDGSSARQHTVDGVIFEEMQLIPEEAFSAITPMLLTTGGFIWMLGTAWDTEGYSYERLSDPDFYVERVNAEEVAEIRPEPQRIIMLKHLEKERVRLTEAQYMQEYLAIPSSKARQIYSDALIKKIMVLKRRISIKKEVRHVCGVDPAGLGEDEGAISIFDTEDNENVEQVDFIITEKKLTTETTDIILDLDKKYDFEKIYVDDGGVGFGVFSELLADDNTKSKVIALNNAQRSLDYNDKKRKKIMKEDLHMHLLKMMERGHIKLLDDPEIRESLKSHKFEYTKDKNLIITSRYNHPVESVIRGLWDAQGKHLNLKVHSIPV